MIDNIFCKRIISIVRFFTFVRNDALLFIMHFVILKLVLTSSSNCD